MKVLHALCKGTTAFLIVAIILLTCCESVIFAANTPVFSVDEVSAMSGKTVDVDIKVGDNPGFNALKLKVEYDNTVLKLKSAKNVAITQSMMFTTSQSSTAASNILVWTSDSNVTANGKIATLTFEVIKDTTAPNAVIDLQCEYCSNQNGENLGANITPGKVTIMNNLSDADQTPVAENPDYSILEKEKGGKILYWWVFIVIPIPVIIVAVILIIMLIKRKK